METTTRPEEARAQPDRIGRTGLVLLIGSLASFGPLSLDMYLPGLPRLASDLGGAEWQAQLTLTTCLLGLAIGQIVAGPLSDAVGRRRPLLVGLLSYGLASLLCALASSMPLLIGLRLVQGLAGAVGIVIARAVVRDRYAGAEAARFFALTMAVNGLAPILAPVIGGQLLQVTSWRGIFVVLAAIGLALLLASAATLGETLPPARRTTGGVGATLANFRRLLTDRAFMCYALSSGLALAAMFAYIAGSPFVLEQIYGVSPQGFSVIFASNALGIIVLSQVSGWLVGRVAPRRLMAAGLGLSLTGGVVLVTAVAAQVGLAGVVIGLFLVVSSVGLIGPNATALAMGSHPEIAGSASGFIGVLQFLIGALITPLAGSGGSSALPMAGLMLLLSLAAVVTFVVLSRPGRQALAR